VDCCVLDCVWASGRVICRGAEAARYLASGLASHIRVALILDIPVS